MANRDTQGIVFAGLMDSADQRITPYNPNVSGIRSFFAGDLCPNWPYLLMQVQPSITQMAIIYDQSSDHSAMHDQVAAIGSAFPQLTVIPIDARFSLSQIESELAKFVTSGGPNTSGLIVTAGTLTSMARKDITRLAASYNLPAIYPSDMYAKAGGLMSYGPSLPALYKKVATDFLKPILSGSVPPSKLQATKGIQTFNTLDQFELKINTSATNGLNLPPLPSKFKVRIPWSNTGADQEISSSAT
jgi:putative ABC transport system substrate-binding protein